MAVTQWNPTHRAICKIRGWEPLTFASWYDLDQKFSILKVFQRPHTYFDYGIQGGSFDLRTYTLDQFYHKHLLGWNSWSRSNEGYDLARYMGTTWTFLPHAHIPYIVFWERNWDTTEFEQLPRMHPFWLLVHRRNTLVVLPRSMRGRKRRLRIPPPSLQTSRWFYASSWVGAALFRIGITPLNIESPFVHKTGSDRQPHYATWIGYAEGPTQNHTTPLPVTWAYSTFSGAGHSWVPIMYRWWWDNGEDNYILTNLTGIKPGTSGGTLKPLKINYPYYVFFYGAMLPQGDAQVENGTQVPGKTPVIMGSKNPTPVAVWWYYDRGVFWNPDKKTLHMDSRYLRPEDLPVGMQNKTWVYLYDGSPFGSGVAFSSDINMENSWTTREVAPRIQALVENSPFVLGKFDIPFGNREVNFLAKYTSVWQWGGTIPKPDTVVDPESLRDQKPSTSSVRNPATVGIATLHPWDLSQGGSIHGDRLRQILTNLVASAGATRTDASRPASPPPSPRPQRRKRPRRRRRSSRERSESDESDEPRSSKSSSGRRWAPSPLPSSSEEETTSTDTRSDSEGTGSESEEEPPPKTPRHQLRPRLLLR